MLYLQTKGSFTHRASTTPTAIFLNAMYWWLMEFPFRNFTACKVKKIILHEVKFYLCKVRLITEKNPEFLKFYDFFFNFQMFRSKSSIFIKPSLREVRLPGFRIGRGANPLGRGRQYMILPNFSKKLHEIENILGHRGWARTPQIRHCLG